MHAFRLDRAMFSNITAFLLLDSVVLWDVIIENETVFPVCAKSLMGTVRIFGSVHTTPKEFEIATINHFAFGV